MRFPAVRRWLRSLVSMACFTLAVMAAGCGASRVSNSHASLTTANSRASTSASGGARRLRSASTDSTSCPLTPPRVKAAFGFAIGELRDQQNLGIQVCAFGSEQRLAPAVVVERPEMPLAQKRRLVHRYAPQAHQYVAERPQWCPGCFFIVDQGDAPEAEIFTPSWHVSVLTSSSTDLTAVTDAIGQQLSSY
jgi:hypothetical protein